MDMLVPCWFLEPNGALRNWRMEVGLISRCWFWNKNAKTLRRVLSLNLLISISWLPWEPTVPGAFLAAVSPISLGLKIFIFHGHKRGPKVVYEEGVLKSLIGIMILYQAGNLSFDVWYLTLGYVGVVFLNGWVVYCFLLDPFVFLELLSFPIRWICQKVCLCVCVSEFFLF